MKKFLMLVRKLFLQKRFFLNVFGRFLDMFLLAKLSFKNRKTRLQDNIPKQNCLIKNVRENYRIKNARQNCLLKIIRENFLIKIKLFY